MRNYNFPLIIPHICLQIGCFTKYMDSILNGTGEISGRSHADRQQNMIIKTNPIYIYINIKIIEIYMFGAVRRVREY